MNKIFNVGFRVDSGIGVGEGHLSRCLSIAKELVKYNCRINFFSKNLLNNSNYLVTQNMFGLEEIQTDKTKNIEINNLRLLNKNSLKFQKLDLIILDSYQISIAEEKYLKSIIKVVVVIDDLINRKFVCDLIINYNFGISKRHYDNLYDYKNTNLLIGRSFIPLKLKNYQLVTYKKINKKKISVFISVGALDEQNYILYILKCLVLTKLKKIQPIILMSKEAPHIKLIKIFLKRNFRSYKLIIGQRNIYKFMLESDFAIGGIGVTASERVVMGLPTIMFSAAPNQDLYLNFFKKIPGIKVITSPIREKVFEVMFWIKFFYNNIQLLRKNSFYAKNYFNADGASKVAKKISLILES